MRGLSLTEGSTPSSASATDGDVWLERLEADRRSDIDWGAFKECRALPRLPSRSCEIR